MQVQKQKSRDIAACCSVLQCVAATYIYLPICISTHLPIGISYWPIYTSICLPICIYIFMQVEMWRSRDIAARCSVFQCLVATYIYPPICISTHLPIGISYWPICTSTHVPICICTHMYMNPYVYVPICICTHMYMYPYVYVPMCIWTHMYMYAYVHVPTCICTHMYMYPYVYVPIRICTHMYMYQHVYVPHVYLHIYRQASHIYPYVHEYVTHMYIYRSRYRHLSSKRIEDGGD